MPQKVIKFAGIDRMVNEFQNTGACEELINLRPTIGGGYEVIKNKEAKTGTVLYDAIYEHTFGDVRNLIAVNRGKVVWIVDINTMETTTITSKYNMQSVSLSFSGNIMLVYNKANEEQSVFRFVDGKYESYDIVEKRIENIEFTYDYNSNRPLTVMVQAEENSVESLTNALNKAASSFHSQYENGLCGAAVVGCTYEFEDGSEMWSTAFVVANVTRQDGYTAPYISYDTNNKVYVSGGRNTVLKLTLRAGESKNIKRINVYSTRAVLPYKVDYDSPTSKIVETSLKDTNLAGQLMFYQGSVSVDEDVQTLPLKFGTGLESDTLMDVTQGCIERTGDVISYNGRFYYFNGSVKHVIQIPTNNFDATRNDLGNNYIAYVNFHGKWRLINKQYMISDSTVSDYIYPMSGVKEIVFVKAKLSEKNMVTSEHEMFKVTLEDSSAYNYSYAFDVTPSIELVGEFYDTLVAEGQIGITSLAETVFWKKEANVLNISAQNNPLIFPVEYSYLFGGEILDITTAYTPISSSQTGQYPITIFTTNGIYSMEQGTGATLYSNIVPLQPLVINGKAEPTPYGTFFVSSKSLYLLSGREVVNVSYTLNGKRDLDVRNSEAYRKLYCSGRSIAYNYEELLSTKDFEEFISGASLTYDQLHNELYISSNTTSYVFNLDTKMFHKASHSFSASQKGARYVINAYKSGVVTGFQIIDMHSEVDSDNQPIFLQSRPMSLDTLSTHIQRLVLLTDATLKDDQHLFVSVFASDNLNDWKCIISSQKYDTVLRQIRTNRAAKSYKDYVFIINGIVDTNTDLSDIIIDYTVVNRRLG